MKIENSYFYIVIKFHNIYVFFPFFNQINAAFFMSFKT